jgi:hypothetical protein
VIVSYGTEDATESGTSFEAGSRRVFLSFSVLGVLEIEGTTSASNHLRNSLGGDQLGHVTEKFVHVATDVEASVESNGVLQNKLGLRKVPGHIDLGENAQTVVRCDQHAFDGTIASTASSVGVVLEALSYAKKLSDKAVKVFVGLKNVGAGANEG